MPPPTTAPTGPNAAAVTPLSHAPNSFEELINTRSTAETRPRIESGVRNGTSTPRMTMLTLSNAPTSASAPSDSQKLRDKPKIIVATPKPATTHSKVLPACCIGGRRVRTSAISVAPTAGAARSQPKPSAPTCNTSLANTGSNATAPPNNTANKSSVIADSTSRSRNTNRTPATTPRQLTASALRSRVAMVNREYAMAMITESSAANPYASVAPTFTGPSTTMIFGNQAMANPPMAGAIIPAT